MLDRADECQPQLKASEIDVATSVVCTHEYPITLLLIGTCERSMLSATNIHYAKQNIYSNSSLLL